MSRLAAFLRRDLLIDVSYRWFWLIQLVQLGGLLFLWVVAAQLVAGETIPGIGAAFLPWVLVGNAGAVFFTTALSAFSARLRREQYSGTLEILFTSRTPFERAVAYAAVYDLLRALPSALTFGAVAWWLGPQQSGPAHAALLIGFLTLGGVVFAALGMLAAAAVLVWQRGDLVVRLISGTAVIFGTAFIPAEILPGVLRGLPSLVPLTPALAGLRGCLLEGAAPSTLAAPLAVLAVEAAVLLPLALLVFRRAVASARRSGSLARY